MTEIPFRLKVLRAVTSALETITPANGFQHDLTGAVFRGRAWFGDGDPLPMISILETPMQPDQEEIPDESEIGFGQLELMVQGFVKDDLLHPTDPAHYLMADVKQALVRERMKDDNILGFGTRVTKFRIGGGACRPADDVSDKAFFWLTLGITIVEDLDDPFA